MKTTDLRKDREMGSKESKLWAHPRSKGESILMCNKLTVKFPIKILSGFRGLSREVAWWIQSRVYSTKQYSGFISMPGNNVG